MIADYRERWSLPENGPLLDDAQALDGSQAADREALDRQQERLRRLLARGSKAGD
jgi:predicted transcriptional regulator